ncbi:hypothetical protein BSKO_04763 [Bryopsis sp. KO-2023]|nr:hypothetical protein BSKO_04763 [Bryopsis sp. KO-2023]
MKASFWAVALLVVLHQGFFANAATECPGAADSSCSAFSTLEILVTAGKCVGTASADCRAVSESTSVFKEAFEEWWGEEGVCDSGKAETAVTSIATAVAKVWSNAAVKVDCDGLGFACGWSISNGNAFALAFAEAIAQAAAEAGASTDANGFCFADVRAVAGVFAEAAARAQADTCTTGGASEDFENSYVQAVQKGIATAFARATASACDVDGEVAASSECFGEADSSTEGAVAKSGDVCGGIQQLQACTGIVKDKCCHSDFRRSLCTCRGCNGPWFKKTGAGDAKKSFANRAGDLCFCLDTADDGVDEESTTEEETEPEAPIEPEIIPAPVEVTETPAEPEIIESQPAESQIEETPAEPEIPETVPEITPESTDSNLEEEATSLKEGQVLGDRATITCPGAVDTTCSAFAALEILVTAGSCSGTASADCRAVTESSSEFTEAFDEWWSEDGTCDSGKAEAAATAVAKAIAKVWANASVKVTCEGMGFACGWSIADGQAWAIAFAEAVAQASAEAGSGNAEGFCFADIRALSSVIAEAAAKAQADACTTGGTVEDFETSYASAIQIGIARAFAQATAEACSADGELIASSQCSGEAESTTEGDSFAYGDACAGIAQIKACTGPGMEMCCDRGFKRTLCNCNRKGCSAGPWIKKSDFNAGENTMRSFEDRQRNVCFCMGNY